MNKTKTINRELNCIGNAYHKMYLECANKAFNIVQRNGLVPNGLKMVRYCATGQPSWRCSMYNDDVVHSGLCKDHIIREIVYNYLKEHSYDPIPSIWRGNLSAGADVMQENLKRAKMCIYKRKCAIVIQRAYKKHLKYRLVRLVCIVQRRWRLKQISRMRPFYLIPTPHTDSRPYIFQPKCKLYKRRPSFGMIYFKINSRIITKDMDRKGGPCGIHRTSWFFDLRAECIYWTYQVGRTFEVRKWTYGKDFTVKITKDVHRFRGILGSLNLNR